MAESTHPDLAIFDVRLAGRRDGIEGAALLRECLGLPAVFITAQGERLRAERARLSGELTNGLEPWLRMIKKKAAKACQPASGNPVALADAVTSDWPDIADAVAWPRVPILLCVEKDNPGVTPLVIELC